MTDGYAKQQISAYAGLFRKNFKIHKATRGRPNFSYGFRYGTETSSKMFCPVSVLAKFPLWP